MFIKDFAAPLPDCIIGDLIDATAEPAARPSSPMNMSPLGFALVLVAVMLNVGCAGSRDGADEQFQRQVKRAHECREMQDKLVGGQPVTPERAEEITKAMD
jgi:hypothetical protein